MLSWMLSIATEKLSCQVFELEGWCQYSYVIQYRCLKKSPNLKWANDVFDHSLTVFLICKPGKLFFWLKVLLLF